MKGNWNGSSWNFSVGPVVGNAGMAFQINACGQVQYFSNACAGAGTMKFIGKTIAQ